MDIQTFIQSVYSLAKAENKKEIGPIGQQVSELAHARNAERKQSGEAISDESVNLRVNDEPQNLVLHRQHWRALMKRCRILWEATPFKQLMNQI